MIERIKIRYENSQGKQYSYFFNLSSLRFLNATLNQKRNNTMKLADDRRKGCNIQ
jgi:hypothetical protein